MPRTHTKTGRTLVEGWKFQNKATIASSRGGKIYFFTNDFDEQVIVRGNDNLTPQQKAAIRVAKRVKKASRTRQANKEAQLGKDARIQRLEEDVANLHRQLEQLRRENAILKEQRGEE